MKRKSFGLGIASHLIRLCMICSPLVFGGVGGGLLCSCGEFWDGGEPVAARKMTLGRRVINLMVGDRYRIPVLFEPDTLSNRSVWWQTGDKDIAIVEDDTVIAVSQGLTLAYALSVSDRQTDSCWVNVLPKMYLNPRQYPYDMVIYADVNIDGMPYENSMEDSLIVAAFCNDELRGIGKMRTSMGRQYMELRVWSPFEYGDPIDVMLISRGHARVRLFDQQWTFDGEAHGTLSALVNMVIDENSEEYFFGIPVDNGLFDETKEQQAVSGDDDDE